MPINRGVEQAFRSGHGLTNIWANLTFDLSDLNISCVVYSELTGQLDMKTIGNEFITDSEHRQKIFGKINFNHLLLISVGLVMGVVYYGLINQKLLPTPL